MNSGGECANSEYADSKDAGQSGRIQFQRAFPFEWPETRACPTHSSYRQQKKAAHCSNRYSSLYHCALGKSNGPPRGFYNVHFHAIWGIMDRGTHLGLRRKSDAGFPLPGRIAELN